MREEWNSGPNGAAAEQDPRKESIAAQDPQEHGPRTDTGSSPIETDKEKTGTPATESSATGSSTARPFATAPSVTGPSATEPSETEGSVTGPSVSEASATEPTQTGSSVSESSATGPSATNSSPTESSITALSATDPSAKEPPKPSVKPIDPPKKLPPQKPAKWELAILIGALAMGLCIDGLWLNQSFLPLSLLWLVMAVMLFFTPGAFRRRNIIAYMALGTAALACVSTFFYDCDWMLMLIVLAVAPGLLMAASVWARMDGEAEAEHLFILEYLLSWIVRPFAGIPRFFGVLRGLLPGKGNPTAMRVAAGLLISIPLLAIVIGLLMMADVYFSSALESALSAIRLDTALGHVFRVAVPMVLVFSFLVSYFKKPLMEVAHPPKASWDRVVLSTVLAALLAIYALFCGFQFFYLFGGHEAFRESGYTYAEYARRGFSEMSLVCGINLFLFWLAVRFAKPARGVSLLLAGLLAATGVMLVSAGLRLGLYIEAYGLTAQRVRAAWMIGVMAAIVIACGAKILRPGLPIVRVAASILMVAFLGLQLSMPDAIVARSDAARLRVQWNEETLYYMDTLSADAVPAMIDLYLDMPEQKAPESPKDRDRTLKEVLQGRYTSLHNQAKEGRWMSLSAWHAYRMLGDLVKAGKL